MPFRPRTKLTAPPGQEPLSLQPREAYSPGFAVPDEPGAPSRGRTLVRSLVTLVVVVVVGYAAFRVATGGRAEDPSLGPGPGEVTTGEVTTSGP